MEVSLAMHAIGSNSSECRFYLSPSSYLSSFQSGSELQVLFSSVKQDLPLEATMFHSSTYYFISAITTLYAGRIVCSISL